MEIKLKVICSSTQKQSANVVKRIANDGVHNVKEQNWKLPIVGRGGRGVVKSHSHSRIRIAGQASTGDLNNKAIQLWRGRGLLATATLDLVPQEVQTR